MQYSYTNAQSEMNEIPSVSKANQQLLYHREETSLHPPQSFSKQLSGTELPPPAPYDSEILSHELAYFPCIDQRAEGIKKQIGCLLRSISVLMLIPDLRMETQRGGEEKKTMYILSPSNTPCSRAVFTVPPRYPQTPFW